MATSSTETGVLRLVPGAFMAAQLYSKVMDLNREFDLTAWKTADGQLLFLEFPASA